VSRFRVSGSVTVESNYLLIQGVIPLLALPFRGKIESTIREKAEELLKWIGETHFYTILNFAKIKKNHAWNIIIQW